MKKEKIFSGLNKKIIILGLAILVIFTGFNGVQQYVTTFFDEKGILEVGFQSLILIYLFFVLANPLAASTAVKYGPKVTVVGGSLVYSFYIFSLISGSILLIYFASAFLGIGAAFIWMGENSYLFRISEEDSRGRNVGFLDMCLFLGSTIGVVGLGFLSSQLPLRVGFLIFAVLPIIGFIILMRLPSIKIEEKKNQFALLWKAAKSVTTVRIAGIWLIVFFVAGLAMGILPVQIMITFGKSYVGILTSFFFVFPVFLSYGLGGISDKIGRKKIILVAYLLIFAGLFTLLFSNIPILLITGTVLLALGWTTARIGLIPLTGDLSTKENLESLIALFWMFQNVGVVIALILGRFLSGQTSFIYIIALALTGLSFISAFSLLQKTITDVKENIAREV